MFQTFAFLDLETTSLSFPKITEIAVVACERSHCDNTNKLPRVLHKFTVCVRPPQKVHPISATISGLDNDILMNVGTFDEDVVQTLRLFLKRLPPPICLVAHNGFKFDFPILKNAIRSCGAPLIDDIYCLDSIPAFKTIFGTHPMSLDHPLLCDPEENKFCLEAIEEYEKEESIKEICMMELNETTPEKPPTQYNYAPKKPKIACKKNNPNSRIIRKLDFDFLPSLSQSSSVCFKTDFELGKKPPSYKLCDLYEYLHGYSLIDSHRAENDAIALLECILKVNVLFFDYADSNAVLLNSS